MCERRRGVPVRAIVGALAAVVVVPLAARVAASLAEVIALSVFAACAVCLVALVRLLRPARVKRPARVTVRAELVRAPYQIQRVPLAVEAPQRVLDGVVLPAGERVER